MVSRSGQGKRSRLGIGCQCPPKSRQVHHPLQSPAPETKRQCSDAFLLRRWHARRYPSDTQVLPEVEWRGAGGNGRWNESESGMTGTGLELASRKRWLWRWRGKGRGWSRRPKRQRGKRIGKIPGTKRQSIYVPEQWRFFFENVHTLLATPLLVRSAKLSSNRLIPVPQCVSMRER